ncbi:MAG TPA: aquaporin, partial [Candidatus Limnocylindrales bacterium]
MSVKKILAELLGSFLFLTLGYLSVPAFHAAAPGAAGLLVVPWSFGFGLLAAIFAFGHISGGHFNPAVTVAMVLDRRTTLPNAVGYVVAQIVGALLAGVFVMAVINQQAVTQGITAPGQGISDTSALLIEGFATAAFLLVILTVTKRAPAVAGIVIPLTLVSIHFATATLSGASVNPARSIGSAVVGGDTSKLWIYIVGPVVGGIIGWIVWRLVDGGGDQP